MPLRLSHRRARRGAISRGQSLVEFALVLPIMCLLLLIAVDFGRLFYTYIGVSNAAREGAAFAAGNPNCVTPSVTPPICSDPDTVQFHARQEMGGDTSVSVSRTCMPAACTASATGTGTEVTVTAARPFTFITPFISVFFGGGLTLGASATAVVV